MSATIIPLRRAIEPASGEVDTIAQVTQLASIRSTLERRREELLGLIEGLRSGPAAQLSDGLGATVAGVDAAACRTLVEIDLMLRKAQVLDTVVRDRS